MSPPLTLLAIYVVSFLTPSLKILTHVAGGSWPASCTPYSFQDGTFVATCMTGPDLAPQVTSCQSEKQSNRYTCRIIAGGHYVCWWSYVVWIPALGTSGNPRPPITLTPPNTQVCLHPALWATAMGSFHVTSQAAPCP